MSNRDSLGFAVGGLLVWGAATSFYAAFGAGLLEASFWFYSLNAFAAAGAFSFAFQVVARLTRHRGARLGPVLAFIAPGVVGAAILMWNYKAFPPGADPASLGRYGAFLLVAYLAVAFEGQTSRARASSPAR